MIKGESFCGVCDECGKQSVVTYGPDPYMEEIHPDKVDESDYKNLCDKCHRSSCMDI